MAARLGSFDFNEASRQKLSMSISSVGESGGGGTGDLSARRGRKM